MNRVKRFSAFTLMEMTTVMLIMSIVLAAAAPMLTTRMRSANDSTGPNASPWHYAENGVDAYFGSSVTQKAMIGQTRLNTGDNGRLIVNISDDVPNHIIFNKKNNYLGRLGFNDNSSLFLGDVSASSSTENTVAVGMDGTSAGPNSVTIGIGASTDSDSVSIGTDAVTSEDSVAIGKNADANTNDAVAIGTNAKGYYRGVAIGRMATANTGAVAIGYNASAYEAGHATMSTVAIGDGTQAHGGYAVSIGPSSKSKKVYTTSVGQNITNDTSYSVSIGTGANNTGGSQANIAIGYGAKTYGDATNNRIAIGTSAFSSGANSVAIGYKAVASDADTIVLGCATSSSCTAPKVIINGDLQLMGNLLDKNGYDVEFGGDKMSWPSDSRLKNIGLENKAGLEQIKQLKVVNYTYKKDEQKVPHVGVIAQDLQKVFPNAVTKNNEGFLTVRMEDMFFAVVNAVKELDNKLTTFMEQVKKENTQLKQDVKQLKTENAELKARLDKLEAKMK